MAMHDGEKSTGKRMFVIGPTGPPCTNTGEPLFSIREARGGHQITRVGTPKPRNESFTDRSIHRAVSSRRLVSKTLEVGLKEFVLEVLARVLGYNFIPQPRRKLIEAPSEHIKTDRRIK